MITALLSFLGGSTFRMLWGEVSHWITAARDHKHEIERMRLQGELDAAQHARNLDALRLQADLGVKVIEAQREADVERTLADAWASAVDATSKATGVRWVDAWNQVIRPAVATWSVAMITGHYAGAWVLDENGWALAGAALGIYLADRALFKRGK